MVQIPRLPVQIFFGFERAAYRLSARIDAGLNAVCASAKKAVSYLVLKGSFCRDKKTSAGAKSNAAAADSSIGHQPASQM